MDEDISTIYVVSEDPMSTDDHYEPINNFIVKNGPIAKDGITIPYDELYRFYPEHYKNTLSVVSKTGDTLLEDKITVTRVDDGTTVPDVPDWTDEPDPLPIPETPAARHIYINSLQDFKDFMESDGTYEGYTIELMRCLDLADYTTFAGKKSSDGTRFMGTFEGHNMILKNVKLKVTKDQNGVGMFPWVQAATIRNLRIDGLAIDDYDPSNPTRSLILSGRYVGGLVGNAAIVSIENCHIHHGIIPAGNYQTGGFIGITHDGYAAGVKGYPSAVLSCTFVGQFKRLYANCAHIGGIIGEGASLVQVDSTKVHATITHENKVDESGKVQATYLPYMTSINVAGIIASYRPIYDTALENGLYIRNCEVYCKMTSNGKKMERTPILGNVIYLDQYCPSGHPTDPENLQRAEAELLRYVNVEENNYWGDCTSKKDKQYIYLSNGEGEIYLHIKTKTHVSRG